MNQSTAITGVLMLLLLALPAGAALARGVYQTPEAFLAEVFEQQTPAPKVIWLSGERKKIAAEIMARPYKGIRVRYWGKDKRTAWILEEIGKELPITVGIVVDANQIKQVKILAFRESRGGEVRYPTFTDQFNGAKLVEEQQLSNTVDGISGATLSVRAVKKLARLALYLHRQTPFNP